MPNRIKFILKTQDFFKILITVFFSEEIDSSWCQKWDFKFNNKNK